MNVEFPNITILGSGLLGGSLAMALEAMKPKRTVRLWARRKETVEAALETGIVHATGKLSDAVQTCDLLVLAVPVGSMPALVSSAIDAGLPDGCLITDVGSVKAPPHQCIPPLLAGRNIDFIGSHPMAGSEQNGLSAATPDLFENAACLLTNDEDAPEELAAALERFWQGVGCRTSWMSAAAHDELVARISHLPHIVAASAAHVCLKNPAEGDFGGGGLRDTTRVASGDPDMWAEILFENRKALLPPLRETIADLGEILNHLEDAGQEPTRQWLATAKQLRDLLKSPQ